MKVLILNGSPKKKGGASRMLAFMFRMALGGCSVSQSSLHSKKLWQDILEQLPSIDALVLSVPLYVDGMPSHVQVFLEQAEAFCRENHCNFSLYVVANNGFIEGKQNTAHLRMYECWCSHSGVKWGGGIGIGGSAMLHIISIIYPIAFSIRLILMAIDVILSQSFSLSMLSAPATTLLIYLFLSSGPFYFMLKMARNLKKGRSDKNRYTRIMIPSFVFIFFADIFMAISSLINGHFPLAVSKKSLAGGEPPQDKG